MKRKERIVDVDIQLNLLGFNLKIQNIIESSYKRPH